MIGIEISGLCSFLFWPYPLTSDDAAIRKRSAELAQKMLLAASWLAVGGLVLAAGAAEALDAGAAVRAADPAVRRAELELGELRLLADRVDRGEQGRNVDAVHRYFLAALRAAGLTLSRCVGFHGFLFRFWVAVAGVLPVHANQPTKGACEPPCEAPLKKPRS